MSTTLTKDNIAREHISAMVPSYWSDMMQVPLRKSLVASAVAKTQFEAKLKKGDTVHFPYLSETSSSSYSPGDTISTSEASATDETLVVDTMRTVANYIEDIEELQSNYSYQVDIADNAAYQLKDDIDQAVLTEVTAAASGLHDDGGITYVESPSSAITATSGNVIELAAQARKALRQQNVTETGDWVWVTDPGVAMQIELIATDKGFSVADATLKNGFAGTFMGYEIYISNNLPSDRNYIGKKEGIHLAAQVPPKMEIKDPSDQLGRNLIASAAYGVKVFEKNSERFLEVMVTT